MLDVAPYMLWGNSEDDETTIKRRVKKAASELKKATYNKIKKAMEKKGWI